MVGGSHLRGHFNISSVTRAVDWADTDTASAVASCFAIRICSLRHGLFPRTFQRRHVYQHVNSLQYLHLLAHCFLACRVVNVTVAAQSAGLPVEHAYPLVDGWRLFPACW